MWLAHSRGSELGWRWEKGKNLTSSLSEQDSALTAQPLPVGIEVWGLLLFCTFLHDPSNIQLQLAKQIPLFTFLQSHNISLLCSRVFAFIKSSYYFRGEGYEEHIN